MTWKAKLAVGLAVLGIGIVVGLWFDNVLSGVLAGTGVVVAALRRRRPESGNDGADQDDPEDKPPEPVEYDDPLEDTRKRADNASDAASSGRDFLDEFDRRRARIDEDG